MVDARSSLSPRPGLNNLQAPACPKPKAGVFSRLREALASAL